MAYRKTEKVQAMLAAKREAFIDAAIQLVESEGMEAFDVNRIGTMANSTVGTLYNHFPDRHELWAACVARVLQGDLNAMQEAFADAQTRGNSHALHPALVALYRRFTRRQLREAIFADASYREGLRRAVMPLLPGGEADSRARVLASAIVGALMGAYQNTGQAREAAEIVATFALRGIGARIRTEA